MLFRSAPLRADAVRLAEGVTAPDIGAVWRGEVHDDFARDIVTGTAALALRTLGHDAPEALARTLWSVRLDARTETAA